MIRRNFMRGFCITAAALPLAGCWGSTYEWNQKITITVQTPTGEKSGSAVTRVNSSMGTYIGAGTMANQTLQGEATVVDLGSGKYLFGLLSEQSKTLAWQVFADDVPSQTELAWAAIAKKQGTVKPLSGGLAPTLVTFGNINDPKSVKQVFANNFAETFGAGYALKSIMLEVTDEPVTVGKVEAALVWISSLKGSYLHGGFTSKGAPFGLHAGNFLMEQH